MIAKYFFYICTIIELVEIVYSFKKTKRLFSIQNIFFVTIVINFWMYLANWSTQFVVPCSSLTYTIIASTQCAVIAFDLVYLKKRRRIEKHTITTLHYKVKRIRIGKRLVLNISFLVMLLCVMCSMIENYISYGTVLPFLHNIDSHKNVIAIFGTIWRSCYPISLVLFLIEYKDRGKKLRDYIYLFFTIVFLLLSGGSRFWSVISIGTAFIFWLTYVRPELRFYHYFLIIILFISSISTLLDMGIKRLTVMTYMEKISYIGPFADTPLGEAFSWYYGYFPYSFNNLNLTLLNIKKNHLYTYGQFFLLPFLYVSKVYKILGTSSYDVLASSVRVVTNSAATVATAYFEFYADFGPLYILPILFYLTILHNFEIKNTAFSIGAYSYCIIIWGFFNFYNVFSNGIPYTYILFLYIICRLFVIQVPVERNKTYCNTRKDP